MDGNAKSAPYEDSNGCKIFLSGNSLSFTTKFGLSVVWDGQSKANVVLCDAYASFVCGLCGNGDKNKTNDYVDRYDVDVELTGTKYTKYYAWGNKWRVNDDSSDAEST